MGRDMSDHKFRVGQLVVNYLSGSHGRRQRGDVFKMMQCLPPQGGDYQYKLCKILSDHPSSTALLLSAKIRKFKCTRVPLLPLWLEPDQCSDRRRKHPRRATAVVAIARGTMTLQREQETDHGHCDYSRAVSRQWWY